jgi:hypothetical protein
MKSIFLSILLLPSTAVPGAPKSKDQQFKIANESAHATAVKVIALDARAGARFAVQAPDGKHVPAWYDRNAKKLLVLTSVPAGGGIFKVLDGVPSRARGPKWGRPATKKEGMIRLGKVVTRVSGSFDNDLLTVTVPAQKQIHGRVIIKSKNSGYKIELSPLGCSLGCVETQEIGKQVNESYQKGQRRHGELFAAYPSIAIYIKVFAPNPFQRVMRVQCHDWAYKNNGKTLDLFKDCGFEITLTWGSPVVKIRSWRNQDKAYWNHNGVMLNEIYVDRQPISIQADDEDKSTERPLKGSALDIPFKKSMRFTDKTGDTIVYQPDFKNLAIYRECIVLTKERVLTILSQSWGEGWKAIEIKAGKYEDVLTLVCDVGNSGKSLKEWVMEIK